MQRRSVLLPLPGAADQADRLARVDLQVAAAQDVVRAEVLLDAEDRTIGSAPGRRELAGLRRTGRASPVAGVDVTGS